MKKIAFALALMTTVFSCNNSEETTTASNTGTSANISNEVPGEENIAELANKPLSKSAEKYKGEYEAEIGSNKYLIRQSPDNPGMLAVTLLSGRRDPITMDYWYNEEEDVLSDKTSKSQKKYTTIKLDPSSETIYKVFYDWERNKADTTKYKRIK